MKTCGRCAVDKPLDSFHPRTYKSGRVGLQSWCKSCALEEVNAHRAQNPERYRELDKAGRARKSLADRRYREHRRYGLAPGEYADRLLMQGGRCEICGEPPTAEYPLCIDHDHSCCEGRESCGRCVRGLVCRHCNWMLGNSHDQARLLRAAAAYLERY